MNASTGLVWSERYLEHDTGPYHPERPERLRAIHDRFRAAGLFDRLPSVRVQPADPRAVELVHDRDYIQRFERACAEGWGELDTPDCAICPASYEIALLAVGGTLAAVDAIMAGEIRNAFGMLRPPGHHAEHNRAMGFCFFNNLAIAAEHLRSRWGLKRLAIVDFDVHHGNGTQHHFDGDPNVFFASIHQHPYTLFPGTGFEWERGHGAGVGSTLNIPMVASSADADYRQAFEAQILPAVREFRPEFLLVSAGFDCHQADPLAQIRLSTEMFGWMTRELRRLADGLCQGRLISVLEGGYHLEALADCAQLHVEMLAEQE